MISNVPELKDEAPQGLSSRRRLSSDWSALGVVCLGFLVLFWSTIAGLLRSWADDPDFSHGFLVPLISAGILFTRREEIKSAVIRGTGLGLAGIVASLAVYFAGVLTCTDFLERLGMWGTLLCGVAFLWGMEALRRSCFPVFFLLFAIPPPDALFSPLRLALKGFATRLSADVLSAFGVSAWPEGNILLLDGLHRIEVADACSGIRSLTALLASAVLLGYLVRAGFFPGLLLAVTTIPLTILSNVIRIFVVSVLLVKWNIDLTEGWSHECLGLGTFCLSLGVLYGCWVFYRWLLRLKITTTPRS
jgi:exosortase